MGLGSGSGSGGSTPGAAGDHSIPPEICLFWLYRPVWISSSSKLVVLTLDHKFRRMEVVAEQPSSCRLARAGGSQASLTLCPPTCLLTTTIYFGPTYRSWSPQSPPIQWRISHITYKKFIKQEGDATRKFFI